MVAGWWSPFLQTKKLIFIVSRSRKMALPFDPWGIFLSRMSPGLTGNSKRTISLSVYFSDVLLVLCSVRVVKLEKNKRWMKRKKDVNKDKSLSWKEKTRERVEWSSRMKRQVIFEWVGGFVIVLTVVWFCVALGRWSKEWWRGEKKCLCTWGIVVKWTSLTTLFIFGTSLFTKLLDSFPIYFWRVRACRHASPTHPEE